MINYRSSYMETNVRLRIMGLSRKKESISHLRDKMDKSQKFEKQTQGHIIQNESIGKRFFCSPGVSISPQITTPD